MPDRDLVVAVLIELPIFCTAVQERNRDDATHTPFTSLPDAVQPGQRHELVLTRFRGWPFGPYHMCDMPKESISN